MRTLRSKMVVLSIALIGVAAIAALMTNGLVHFYRDKSVLLKTRDLRLLLETREFQKEFEGVLLRIQVALSISEPTIALDDVKEFNDSAHKIREAAQELELNPQDQNQVEQEVQSFSTYATNFLKIATNPKATSDLKLAAVKRLKETTEVVREKLQNMVDRSQRRYDDTLKQIESYTATVANRLPLIVLVLMLTIMSALAILGRSILNRLSKMKQHFLAADLDKLEPFSDASYSDELSVMANAANRMLESFKEARSSLVEKEFMDSIFNAVGESILVMAPTGTVLKHNQAWEQLVGQDHVTGAINDILKSSEVHLEEISRMGVNRSLRGHWKSPTLSREVNFLVNISALPGGYAGCEAMVLIVADISNLVQVEAEKRDMAAKLAQSSKLASLGEMGVGIAHELNNPLTAIRGFAEIIKSTSGLPPRASEPLQKIIRASERMRKIVDHIRKFGRTSKPDEMEIVDIRDVVNDAYIIQESQFSGLNIKVYFDLGDAPVLIQADSTQLESVFHNLMTNSRDAFKELPHLLSKIIHINLRINEDTQKFTLSFEDNAGGIPEAVRDRIFDPFFTTKDVGVGTGLGLSIALGAMKRHEGSIELLNNTPGRSVFVMTFPLRTDLSLPSKSEGANVAPGAQSVMAVPLTQASRKLPVVMIVDDEVDITDLLTSFLEDVYRVVAFNDPLVAWDAIQESQPDLLMTDIKMPKMNGYQLIAKVREGGFAMPILVISGHAKTAADEKELKGLGATAVIAKPFKSVDFVIDLVEESLAHTQKEFVNMNPNGQDNKKNVDMIVLDDEPDVCELVESYLTESGFKVRTFSNLADCLQFLDRSSSMLAFVDFTMNGVAGPRLVQELLTKAPQLRIVTTTGHNTSSPEVQDCLKAGAVGLLGKPFSMEEGLMSCVMAHTAKKAS